MSGSFEKNSSTRSSDSTSLSPEKEDTETISLSLTVKKKYRKYLLCTMDKVVSVQMVSHGFTNERMLPVPFQAASVFFASIVIGWISTNNTRYSKVSGRMFTFFLSNSLIPHYTLSENEGLYRSRYTYHQCIRRMK